MNFVAFNLSPFTPSLAFATSAPVLRMLRFVALTVLFALGCISTANALPTFSRQTEQPCAACHLNVGELTPEGRKFKLMGYTAGKNVLPFSVTATGSVTQIKSTSSSVAPDIFLAKNDQPILEEANLYAAGKFWENVGGYLKFTESFANTNPIYGSSGVQTGTKVGQDTFLDSSELRITNESRFAEHNVAWGFSLNNSPTISDLWSTGTVYGFPYRSSTLQSAWGMGQFGPSSLIDGGLASQVLGLSAYAMIDENIYLEIADYVRSQPGWATLSVAGPNVNTVRTGNNPYWRLAWNKTEGENSYMFGTFGMRTNLARDPLVAGSASGTYTDYGFDTQFQHITSTHSFSAQAALISENTDWGARSLGRSHDNATSNLVTLKSKVTYDYARKYGISLFEFSSKGTTDNLYWSYNPDQKIVTGACNQQTSLLTYCSVNGSPNTSGSGFELYYDPIPYVHIVFQQTYYQTFLGGGTFVDNSAGLLRSASANNLSYFYALLSY